MVSGLRKYGHWQTQNILEGRLSLSLEARRVTKAGQLSPPLLADDDEKRSKGKTPPCASRLV